MTEADQIRRQAFDDYVRPARKARSSVVAIAAKDIHERMGLTAHYPNVCLALRGRKFQEEHGIELVGTIGPDPSSTTVFIFKV